MKKILLALTLASGFVFTVPASAASFTQCPGLGADTLGCELLITFNADGSFTTVASVPDQGPYDGVEDTLIGVQNNNAASLTMLHLIGSSSPPIFGFDGDGACTFTLCTGGDSTGYGGFVSATAIGVHSGAANNVFFSGIGGGGNSGDVNFRGGILTGGSAWFSLEGPVKINTIVVGTPEPRAVSLLLCLGFVGFAIFARKRRLA
jgi:hypothetical protein